MPPAGKGVARGSVSRDAGPAENGGFVRRLVRGKRLATTNEVMEKSGRSQGNRAEGNYGRETAGLLGAAGLQESVFERSEPDERSEDERRSTSVTVRRGCRRYQPD